ncbi:MAG TPA: hypothetical protein VLJ83_06380 [Gemmatimonadaceae bacterium]|nr:hypothetical protein [Gemmatimonadaceae bacterium]
MTPSTLVTTAYLLRGALLWAVTRATISLFLVLGGGSGVALPFVMIVLVVAAVVLLGWIDIRRQHERILLGNLGIRPLVVSVLLAAPAVIGETLLSAGAAVFA